MASLEFGVNMFVNGVCVCEWCVCQWGLFPVRGWRPILDYSLPCAVAPGQAADSCIKEGRMENGWSLEKTVVYSAGQSTWCRSVVYDVWCLTCWLDL